MINPKLKRRYAAHETKKFNKELIENYPFLLPVHDDGTRIKGYDYLYTLLDDLGEGWKEAFGYELAEDLKNVLVKHDCLHDFKILQLKEKFGSMRLYYGSMPEEVGKEIDHIIDAYEEISAHTCYNCGKLDVCLIDHHGYTLPLCKDCVDEMEQTRAERGYIRKEYDEFTKYNDDEIPNFYKYTLFTTTERTVIERDISEIVEKVRAKYNN